MKEQAVHFGAQRERFGVLSLPDALDPDRPVVLIPSTGIGHRIGPGRLHVELARALATAGVAAFRFDLAGCGDSDFAAGEDGADAARDLVTAMDALMARGLPDRYIGAGLCAGAHHVHQAARIDPRLVGAIFLDGYAYKTPRFWVNYGMDRLTHSKRYAGTPERNPHALAPRGTAEVAHDALPEDIGSVQAPTPAGMKADLQTFIARNMALCFVYTGELAAEYNYREQLTDAFPLLRSYPLLTLRLVIEADHAYSRRATRDALIRSLVDWCLSGPRPIRVRPPETPD